MALLTVLFRLVESFKTFGMIFALTLGGPGRATEIYTLYTYRTAFKYFNFGTASVLGLLLLGIAMVIITIFSKTLKQIWA